MSQVLEIGGEKVPFRGWTDLPLYGKNPGWCRQLTNFRVMPGGYLEARLGIDAIKPSGGTAADPISGGVYTGGHEHTMADGFIFTTTGGGVTYSGNLAQRGQYQLIASGAAQHDAIYIGSTLGKFSRFVPYIGQAITWNTTAGSFAYEYPTAAAWDTDGATNSGTFTLTTTPTFTSTGDQVLEVQDPGAAWVPAVRNGIYAYWIRIRLSSVGGTGVNAALRQGPTSTTDTSWHKAYADWPGARQIYVSTANPGSGAGNGTLKYYGQTSGTQVAWQNVSTSLFSGNYARSRFASYRNLLYFVNGKESKRWDGNTLADIGLSKPTSSGATVNVAGAGNLTGLFSYAITYGYGPLGEWGESNELQLGQSGAIAAKSAVWTLNLTSIPATAEYIYLYRTTDLTSVPSTATTSFPQFRIQTVSRDATGSFPTTITDNTVAFPFPPVELDITVNTAPVRCKYITIHKNRLFLANNNQFPGRVWWSQPFEAEAFNMDENYADFTRSTGGQITGIVEFADQVVCFTEDKMFGVANVDQDVPSIYEITQIPGVGCIAPDSIATGFGVLCWLARNGVYVWDGSNPPQRVSDPLSTTLGQMSFEGYGGSRGVLHNRLYDFHLLTSAGAEVGTTFPRIRFDLVTKTWASVALGNTSKPSPIVSVTAPLGHGDAGIRHPLMGVCQTGTNTDYAIYLGECTTGDAGSAYTGVLTVHMGPSAFKEWTVDRIYTIYDLTSAPVFSHLTTLASVLGNTTGTLANQTVDQGFDYNRLVAIPPQAISTGDLAPTLQVTSANSASQTATTPGHVMVVGLEGTLNDPQWTGSA